MIQFPEINLKKFLTEYWQKKPLVIRKALPHFVNPLTPDELAGLAMEEEIESRIVYETPQIAPYWHLKKGPFIATDFTSLPETHWTLLVQGVDRFVPEVTSLLDNFNFVPQWRVDDVMISYAAEHGSVGPHYDNYDVFLYQAKGSRKWSLTRQDCHVDNYLAHVDLRIMAQFHIEEEFILEEGDMLYLPPHLGHWGVAVFGDSMTYSFGYRSYQGQELWDSFAEYLSQNKQSTPLYQDPSWTLISNTAELPEQAWLNAKKLLQNLIDDSALLKSWFGCFVTQLDQDAERLLPMPLEAEFADRSAFMSEIARNISLLRNPLCRFAYQVHEDEPGIVLFINGCQWDVQDVSIDLVKLVANNRLLTSEQLSPFFRHKTNQTFIFELWKLQWIELCDND